jgi:adenine-specific DNA-methyltransferase
MPPSRVRYASYYHLWTTICRNDRPLLFGKAKRRADTADAVAASVFEEFRRTDAGKFIAVDAIDRLLQRTRAKWIILSYNSGGRATAQELLRVIQAHGTLRGTIEVNHKRNVMAGMTWTHAWTRERERPNTEFLFLMEKK